MIVLSREGSHTWQQFDGDQTLMWRAEKLHKAGFSEAQAAWLALCPSVDSRYAVELLRAGLLAGSTPETIFDLLAE